MNMKNKDLKRRIIDISYKHKLAHIGSCLTAVDIIDEIYSIKKPWENFVLSSGHAGLALYCVIEKYGREQIKLTPAMQPFANFYDAEKIFNHHGVHPDRCVDCMLDCSAGSLGQGLPIAVGMALARPDKNVYCLISDGECSEGSIFEAMNVIKREKIENLKLYVNFNGWAAYRKTDESILPQFGKWYKTNVEQFPFLKGQDAHYKVMNEEEYKQALEILR